jgi:hypothetical protein
MTGSVEKGLQRVAWDLRQPAHELPPNRPRGELEELFGDPLVGPFVVPGKYSVTLSQRVGGALSSLGSPVTFNVVLDPQVSHTPADLAARWQFAQKLQTLRLDIADRCSWRPARRRGSTPSCRRSTPRLPHRGRCTSRRGRSRNGWR